MLQTPLKHPLPPAVAHHAPAQHAPGSTPTRCSPHPAHAHELNLAEWLHMSPAQVSIMSPVPAPYTPPNSYHHHHHLFVPTPSPLQYASVVANAGARNDFLATSSLSYSPHPFQVPGPYHQQHHDQYHQHVQMHAVHHHLHDPMTAGAHTGMGPSPLNAEYFSYGAHNSAPSLSGSTSPVSHQGSPFAFSVYARATGEGESTPVTTLSVADESQARTASQEKAHMQPFIDKLRGASPVTDAGTTGSSSPERPQRKPIESTESPFHIAAPQPRPGSGPFSPVPPSSRPTSALGALSELAELASRQSTPSLTQEKQSQRHVPAVNGNSLASHPSSRPVSRPTSALSTRSTSSHAKVPKVRRRQPPPHRFEPSILRVQLPYQQSPEGASHANGSGNKSMTPSQVDNLPRGPLELDDDSHRYRTRSKLRNIKAEIQEREREADLMLIRRGLRGESADAAAGPGDKSGLEMLASVSVTRRIGVEDLAPTPAPAKRSETPMSSASHAQKNTRAKRVNKRAFKDLEDADCESVTTVSDCGSRTPSKRPRIPTEKAASASASAHVKREVSENRSLRSRVTRSTQERRPTLARTSSSQKSKQPARNTRTSSASAPAGGKKAPSPKVVKDDTMDMDIGESELSSLSSMSDTEEDASDYSPKKSVRGSRSKGAAARGPSSVSASAARSSSARANGSTGSSASFTPANPMSIDTERGAAAIPMPVRTFPAGVPIHAGFPLLYRKFPVPGFTDPNFNPDSHPSPFGSPLSSLAPSPSSSPVRGSSSSQDDSKAEDDEREPTVPPPPSSGHFNAPRGAEDLYTPRFVRGVGRDKMGLCPICYESPERGGAGRAEWLSMKFSAFNYHMQYAHGISPITAQPFSPPVAFRITSRTPNHKNEKSELLEGKCHRCQEWAPVEGVKCVEAKLKEIYWWKHAAQCHKGSTIEGEKDALLEDAVATRIRKVFDTVHARQHPAVPVLPTFCSPAAKSAKSASGSQE